MLVWVVVALGLGVLAITLILIFKRPEGTLQLIQQQLMGLNDRVSKALGEVSASTSGELARLHQNVGSRLDKNNEIFTQVQVRLERLEEANRQIRSVGEEISKLQEILRVPKMRGTLGELFLEELLSQVLPASAYQMQYEFRGGEKVDAVIRLPQGNIVSIDAKFPLENFRRLMASNLSDAERTTFRKAFFQDVRKHVDQIAAKYIRPGEGTLDFAFLYIPAENVYYEVIAAGHDDPQGGYEHALAKRVIPVSPATLYAYLQLVVLGLRGLHIEKEAVEIVRFLSRLQIELGKLQEETAVLGRHLNNATAAFERGEKKIVRIQESVAQMSEKEEPAEGPPQENLSSSVPRIV